MTKELKAKWLDALRSGTYVQGFGTLHQGNKFCCLGVLCDIAGYEWESTSLEFPKESDPQKCKAGLDWIENDEELENLGLPYPLMEECYNMNDGTNGYKPQLFTQIADWLEENLPITNRS